VCAPKRVSIVKVGAKLFLPFRKKPIATRKRITKMSSVL
jgi:hypothetical protein